MSKHKVKMQHSVEVKVCSIIPFGEIEGRLRKECSDIVRTDELHQTDTYFTVPDGLFKLRKETSEYSGGISADFIFYHRSDESDVRDVGCVAVAAPQGSRQLLSLLCSSLAIDTIVEKKRILWLRKGAHHTTRIHLDAVQGLGNFVEIVAVLGMSPSERMVQQATAEVRLLLDVMGFGEAAVEKFGYRELVTHRATNDHQ